MTFAGIDPGKTGAICVIDESRQILSTNAIPTIGKEVDKWQLANLIRGISRINHCSIEHVHSIFGAGAKSNFSYGFICGMLEVLLITNRIPYGMVQPKKWQSEIWDVPPIKINTGKKTAKGNIKYKTDTKATSLMVAQRLFPDCNFLASERSKVPHDGIVDALLLAEYSRRLYK